MKTRIQLPLTVLSSFCALGLVPGVQAVTFTNSTYPVESGPNPVAVADVNGDGRLDIICPDFGYRSDLPGTPGGWNTHLTVLTNGTSFAFGFPTVSGQNCTVQENTNLATTNWVFYTNFTGDGIVDAIGFAGHQRAPALLPPPPALNIFRSNLNSNNSKKS